MDIRKFFTGSGAKCNRIAEKRHEESKTKPVTKATPTKQRTKKDTQITSSSSKPKSKPSREQKDENKDKNGNVEDKIITDRSKRQKTQDAVDKKQLQKKAKKHAEIDAVSPPEVKESSKKEKKRHLPSSDDETYDEIRRRPKKKNKKGDLKRGVIFDSDSEEEPIPKKRAKKVKKEYHLSSDEESKQALIEEAFKHANSGTKKKSTPVTKDSSPSPKKMVDIKEFFGNTPVQRKEQKQVTSKHSKPNPKRETEFDDDDLEIHDDDEFNETLRQLDDNGQIKPAERLEKTTLSSKIAKKVEESYWVGDTPEKTMKTKSSPAKVVPAANKKVKETSPGKTPTKQPSHTKTSPNKPETKKWAYKSYLNREGPRSLGSKEVPQGGENCLEGLNFVITGVLESFERDDVKSIIERYGGKVTGSVSKRTNYLIVGREAGDSKLTKANLLGTKIIDEDGLLDLIRTSPGKKSKYEIAAEKEAKSALKKKTPCKSQNDCKSNSSDQNTSLMSKPSCLPSSTSQTNNASKDSSPFIKIEEDQHKTTSHEESLSGDTLLWVDKYKPTSLKQIIGQQGDKSNAKKLLNWLKHWHKNIASGKKPAFNRFNDDGSGYRAALLSGPPGVGKTTTVHLVCQEAGFSFVELNASDTRSKRSLKEEIAESLNNHSLSGLFGKESSCKLESGKFHCLVMDEVDGMAGNEDRGGIQELVSLIKNTRIPIICMCNDRNHPKIRTLANYCFDLRFQRPRVEQIKSAMMSLAFKEGIKIPPPALNDIIIASNQDIRQHDTSVKMYSIIS